MAVTLRKLLDERRQSDSDLNPLQGPVVVTEALRQRVTVANRPSSSIDVGVKQPLSDNASIAFSTRDVEMPGQLFRSGLASKLLCQGVRDR